MFQGTLSWKMRGVVSVTDTRQCAFAFVERNTATPPTDGGIKMTDNGTVCDVPISVYRRVGAVLLRIDDDVLHTRSPIQMKIRPTNSST